MNINTDLLLAFLQTYEQGSFTKAAKKLHLTQSALSQKIAKLEGLLEVSLLIRKTDGLSLTSAGEQLLSYSKQALQMEENFIQKFKYSTNEVVGNFRLAGFSSVVRSILIPRLAIWMRKNPSVTVEFMSREMGDLSPMLKTNAADMIVLDYHPQLNDVEEVVIGQEEYVLIESTKYPKAPDIYLDHGTLDNATQSFFRFQGMKTSFKRGFMGDVYGILDGVASGLGKAVMSRHLIEDDPRFKVVKVQKKYFRPIVLCYFTQEYYSPLQKQILEILKTPS